MRAHDRVGTDNGLAPLDTAPRNRGVSLLDARMGRLQAVQPLLELRAEAVVGLDGVDKQGVAAGLGFVEDVKEGGAGGLLLV